MRLFLLLLFMVLVVDVRLLCYMNGLELFLCTLLHGWWNAEYHVVPSPYVLRTPVAQKMASNVQLSIWGIQKYWKWCLKHGMSCGSKQSYENVRMRLICTYKVMLTLHKMTSTMIPLNLDRSILTPLTSFSLPNSSVNTTRAVMNSQEGRTAVCTTNQWCLSIKNDVFMMENWINFNNHLEIHGYS
jgi:hypothetical protein